MLDITSYMQFFKNDKKLECGFWTDTTIKNCAIKSQQRRKKKPNRKQACKTR